MGFFKRLFTKKKQQDTTTTNKETKHAHQSKEVSKTSTSNSEDNKTRRYHVSMNNDKKSEHYKSWRVRLESSEKTIKYFDTQKEAITYAETLAKQANSSVVIHKMDGNIRKQDYK
ncbi:MAG: DUF2188 domain-containing protein [Candidatus Izemoplasmataceae bacterium]